MNDVVDALFRAAEDAQRRLRLIAALHERQSEWAGMQGDFCAECGDRWPCNTRKLADGTYVDPAE